mgnify:CR=1 FL=1
MKYFTSLLICIACFGAPLAQSQELDNWYSVEVLIFSNEDSAAIQAEVWPQLPEPERRDAVSLQAASNDAEPFSLMKADQMILASPSAQLRRSGQYRTLLHTGWIQPVQRTQNPTPVRIVAGNILDNGRYELEGYLGIGRGQYLHVRPDLYLNRLLTPAQASALERSTPQETGSAAITTYDFAMPEILSVHLDQPRRMRSGEIHYIDHPLFGILVSINPL